VKFEAEWKAAKEFMDKLHDSHHLIAYPQKLVIGDMEFDPDKELDIFQIYPAINSLLDPKKYYDEPNVILTAFENVDVAYWLHRHIWDVDFPKSGGLADYGYSMREFLIMACSKTADHFSFCFNLPITLEKLSDIPVTVAIPIGQPLPVGDKSTPKVASIIGNSNENPIFVAFKMLAQHGLRLK